MCLTPFKVKTGESVPCGKCPVCKARRVSAWSFRLMQQERISDSAIFLTLTYDNDNVPITKRGHMGLCKRDLQLFFKRLRKAHEAYPSKPIKYYAAGEYGGKTFRPHYHIILFNALPELIEGAWRKDDVVMGSIHFGFVSEASVGYTLKYINKPKTKKSKGDDRQPEFALMSKGLGANYLTQKIRTWHLADLSERMYCNLKDGKKIAMPRYYKNKLYTDKQRAFAAAILQQRFREKEFEEIMRSDKYLRNKTEAAKAAFRAMEYKANLSCNNKI